MTRVHSPQARLIPGELVMSLPCPFCFGRGGIYKNGVRAYNCSSCGGSGEIQHRKAAL